MTFRARLVRCSLLAAALAAGCATSSNRRVQPSPASGTFGATSVTLRGMGADRISSAVRAPNGDVVLGVVAAGRGGSVVRVQKRKRVITFRTGDPVASVGIREDGRICWVPYVRPIVTCRRDDGAERAYPIPGSQPAPRLLRFGSRLYAVDVTHGRVFTIGSANIRYFASFTPEASVTPGSRELIVVAKTARCSLRADSSAACVPLRPPQDGPAHLAAAGGSVFVSDYPAAAMTIITPDGMTARRDVQSAPYNVTARDGTSVWVGMSDPAGYLVLYALSQRDLRRYDLPPKLQGYLVADAMLLPRAVGDDLVVVDNHQRLVTFLTMQTGSL